MATSGESRSPARRPPAAARLRPGRRWLSGIPLAGVGIGGAVAHPVVAWLIGGATAVVLLAVLVVISVVLLRPDPQQSPFTRLMRLLSLILNRVEP
jgi:hypothetical protein